MNKYLILTGLILSFSINFIYSLMFATGDLNVSLSDIQSVIYSTLLLGSVLLFTFCLNAILTMKPKRRKT